MSRGSRQQILKLGKTIYKNFCGQKQINIETWKNLQNYHVDEQRIETTNFETWKNNLQKFLQTEINKF